MHLAEERGFEVVHAIVDCLYITKPGMTVEDVKAFQREIEAMSGIPVSFEGIFKWVVFLASRVDPHRALPSTYFGVFDNGEAKVRGLEVRQRGVPVLVKEVQENAIRMMKDCVTPDEVRALVPQVCRYAREVLRELPRLKPSLLTVLIRISKTEYTANCPQKIIVAKLASRGVRVEPGQFIEFIHSEEGPVLAYEYRGRPDKRKYRALLIRALAVLFQPFGFTTEHIRDLLLERWQLELDFTEQQDVPKKAREGSRLPDKSRPAIIRAVADVVF
jgi:DNA polymerase elongation subunit (family B)